MTTSPTPCNTHVDILVGSVRVRATDCTEPTVDVQPRDPASTGDVDAAANIMVEFDGEVRVRDPRRTGMGIVRSWLAKTWQAMGSVVVTVEVPAGGDLEATVGQGDVRTEGRLGGCHVRTGLGDIVVDEAATLDCKSGAGDIIVGTIAATADVTTASGRISIGNIGGDATVRNSNGRTSIDAADASLRVKAANGEIELGRVAGDVKATSHNGAISLDHAGAGSVVLETHVGTVEVGVPHGTRAWLDLEATAGAVTNQLAKSTAGSTAKPDGPTVRVRVRTSLGQIIIRRPEATTLA